MNKYKVAMFGSAGIRPMEFDENFMSDQFAEQWVERSARYYYPTFTSAAVWRLNEDGTSKLLAEFTSQVSVSIRRPQ